jgi:hypothetical protein
MSLKLKIVRIVGTVIALVGIGLSGWAALRSDTGLLALGQIVMLLGLLPAMLAGILFDLKNSKGAA